MKISVLVQLKRLFNKILRQASLNTNFRSVKLKRRGNIAVRIVGPLNGITNRLAVLLLIHARQRVI